MHRSELEELILADEVLVHGCSIDNLANILVEDMVLSGLKGHGGPTGVSLTTSLEIARQFCRTHEDEFTEILRSWYDVSCDASEPERQGAILVFFRSALSDLTIVPFRDIDNYDEFEERVVGDIDRVFDRVAAIVVCHDEIRRYEAIVDEAFRALAEPADELLAALEAARAKFVSMDALPIERAGCVA